MRLTAADASFIYGESASSPMHISSVYVLDGELDFRALMNRFEKRIHQVPSYRRKLQQVPFSLAHPVWVDDAEFDLTNHVVHHELAAGTSIEDAFDAAVAINEPLLDRDRPLWKVVMISGVEGKTLLLQMAHHAMIDGASGVELTLILFDLDKDAGEPVPPNEPWQPEPTPAPVQLVADAVRDNMQAFNEKNPMRLIANATANASRLQQAGRVMSQFAAQPVVTTPFNAGTVGPKRRARWMKQDFSDIRTIRKSLGGTINDVVLTVVSEAVARYLVANGERADEGHLRIMCPVNVRTEDKQGALGNQVSAIFPRLPAEPIPPAERLHAVIAETERIKRNEEAQLMTLMQDAMPHVPPVAMWATQLVGTALDPTAAAAQVQVPATPAINGRRPPHAGINFVCTNVPGVQVPQYMCGLEVMDTVGLLVLTGNVGLGITILSYNKQLFFSFICDPNLLPDLDVIADAARDVFGELLEVAQANAA